MQIGEKIKQIRIAYGLTQEELATRTELSKGFISQLENDLTSPSIATLKDILQCLGTNLSEFFAEDIDEQVVFTENDYFEDVKEGIRQEWIVPTSQKNKMEPLRITLVDNGETNSIPPTESEFFGYVIKGRITIKLGIDSYNVKAGESFYYLGNKIHKIISKKGATFIWISNPPVF